MQTILGKEDTGVAEIMMEKTITREYKEEIKVRATSNECVYLSWSNRNNRQYGVMLNPREQRDLEDFLMEARLKRERVSS